jgi:hypothetical protein
MPSQESPARVGSRILAKRCTSSDRRLLHDHKSGPLQVAHDPPGGDSRHILVDVVLSLAPLGGRQIVGGGREDGGRQIVRGVGR